METLITITGCVALIGLGLLAAAEAEIKKLKRQSILDGTNYGYAEDRIAEIEVKRDNWKQIVADNCKDDTAIRKLAKPFADVEGDSYGVPTI